MRVRAACRRALGSGGVCMLAVLLGAGGAAAAWTARGTGGGAARAITLAAPTGVSLTCTHNLLPQVAWTAVPGATGYTVKRSLAGLFPTAVGTTATTSLSDASGGLLSVLAVYSVVATSGNWTSGAGSVTVTLAINSLSGKCA